MKVYDRLKLQIRKDLLLAFIFSVCAAVFFIWVESMPKLFVFLAGGAIFFLVEAIFLWIKSRETDPLMDEIVAIPVMVLEVNEDGIVLEGKKPVPWSEVDEVRKVYRAIGHLIVMVFPVMSPVATRRFFYVIQLRNGEWMELSNVGFLALNGWSRNRASRSPESSGLLKRFLEEVGKQQPRICLICHNEASACSEALDIRKEMDDLSKYEKN